MAIARSLYPEMVKGAVLLPFGGTAFVPSRLTF
jgi:hypothetical protein